MLGSEITTETGAGLVFTFPGQGSYSHQVLREIYNSYPQFSDYFAQANEVARELLNGDFLSLVSAADDSEHDERLSVCPDLDQIGIFVSEVLIAKILIAAGVKPALLVGHSFGELAALATAGVYSFETGVRIVADRVRALQSMAQSGVMAAVSCDLERTKRFLEQAQKNSVTVSVINQPRQTVVSGKRSDLEELQNLLNSQGVSLTFLKSRYPYHSPLLDRAVAPFREALEKLTFRQARIPVFLCMEKMLYSPGTNLAHALSSQFIRPLDFRNVVTTLYESGYRNYVECGAGNIVTKLIEQNLAAHAAEIKTSLTASSGQSLQEGLEKIIGEAPAATDRMREISLLVDEMSQLVEKTRRLIGGATAKPSIEPERVYPSEQCDEIPIAIVSLGCVLPGASGPDHYWSNILNGVSGISDLSATDPSTRSDFLIESKSPSVTITPDKTYTLLHGSIVDIPYDATLLAGSYSNDEFRALTNGQQLLALALAQSISSLRVKHSSSTRLQCILGATADGSKEYDDALFCDSVQDIVATLDEPADVNDAFRRLLDQISVYRRGDAERLSQHKIYEAVVEKVAGSRFPTYVVDTACSSSLYSVYFGIKGLQDDECDLVFAGGVFAPGPANNTLFAQFKGLAQEQSRPFDAGAEGVVFGDGAGIVVLKRLPDALRDGDRIHGVIRGIGLSSDGRSPSINVPQAKGQSIAMRSAYQIAALDIQTIQYVEAHATATIVGDAVEFNALKDVMERAPESPRIELGSVKALIGHTGWVAGVASMIKVCKAFEARTIPRQYNYVSPSPEIDLAGSQFTISQASHAWPANVNNFPRRAAINGFGFGGTNAHLILEDFEEPYHRQLCQKLPEKNLPSSQLAVVSIANLFPAGDGAVGHDASQSLRFARESLRLPPRKMLLPDVTDHMDPGQFLAALAASSALEGLPAGWERFRNEIGVVLGIESKTERGRRANERIFADRLRRQVLSAQRNGSLSDADLNRVLDKIVDRIRSRNVPSGPYTLPGLMPNVTASRITHMFDLNGPNIVIDAGRHSLPLSLFAAQQLLSHAACKMVLAGAINANSNAGSNDAECALLLGLTTVETAEREAWPILSKLSLEPTNGRVASYPNANGDRAHNYRGADGATEILDALRKTREQHVPTAYSETSGPLAGRSLVFQPAVEIQTSEKPTIEIPRSHAYVQGTPIRFYSPRLIAAKPNGDPKSLQHQKILFVIDQPDQWSTLENSGALALFNYRVVSAGELNLASDESIAESLAVLDQFDFDVVIAIKSLADQHHESLLRADSHHELRWIEALFAVCRKSYETIKSRRIPILAVCLNSYHDDLLDPYTGLASGFIKSLSRELDGPLCRVINTDSNNFYEALKCVEIELSQPNDAVEVCYRESARSTFTLVPIERLSQTNNAYIDSESVVIATGGARGVTAVLIEDLLRKAGCRVIALGRTDPHSAPEQVRVMDDQAIANYEAEFYRQGLAQGKKKITELKQEYRSFRAANEVSRLTSELQAISGKYEYHSVDIVDREAIDRVVEEVYRKYGRVDLVLHGAGIQISKALTKKSIHDFRRIIATKLDGLSNLYNACEKHRNGRPVHFHILTSAFSYMGNDGQPDYGAANEAMNRIAECMNSRSNEAHWSSMAWLGWAGIGMTRDSEFAALAASRRLRGVTKEEGQQIFAELMQGPPTTPVNILMADGEIDFYKVAISSTAEVAASPVKPKALRNSCVIEREVSVESIPYLNNHLVDGVPTLPGAFVISIFADAAQELRPNLKIISFENAAFRRFTKVFKQRKTRLRVESRIVSEDDASTVVQVRILSDFVHSSGITLQKDVLQHEILVRMAGQCAPPPRAATHSVINGSASPDPFTMNGSSVLLSGPFDAIKNLIIGPDQRSAHLRLDNVNDCSADQRSLLAKIVLMDSLWRFGVIRVEGNAMPVFVPEACEVMKIFFDFHDFVLPLSSPLTLSGANPRPDGERLHMGPVEATDENGNTLVVVERGICRRFGEVKSVHGLYTKVSSVGS
jgi:acyl transferase domain-containing protein/NAD(P)-dependent dehydrogenase (short-subunit alcohol dehydrogenase family)